MRARITTSIIAALLLAGCDDFPKDPESTLDHVQASKRMRVALTAMEPGQRVQALKFLDALERRTGARAIIGQSATEPAFAALDEGRLDLVIGPFGKASPWAADVAFGPPLAVAGSKDHPIEVKAAMRNGENRWIMLVEDASRTAAPETAK